MAETLNALMGLDIFANPRKLCNWKHAIIHYKCPVFRNDLWPWPQTASCLQDGLWSWLPPDICLATGWCWLVHLSKGQAPAPQASLLEQAQGASGHWFRTWGWKQGNGNCNSHSTWEHIHLDYPWLASFFEINLCEGEWKPVKAKTLGVKVLQKFSPVTSKNDIVTVAGTNRSWQLDLVLLVEALFLRSPISTETSLKLKSPSFTSFGGSTGVGS